MCGIAGFVQRRKPHSQVIERMLGALAHRGPDGQGMWTSAHDDWHITLGHRRLAIIDLAGGAQPLGNEDATVQVTFNGEIYNFQSLRDALTQLGHRFTTRCDTEVIVHHHEQHGAAGVADFDGMFAFAVWDTRNGTLSLARDRVGIKPLYYAPLPDGGIAFASELTALLQHPDIGIELDPDALASYFLLDYAHPPRTILRDTFKLQPAHRMEWRDGRIYAPVRYWALQQREHPPREAADAVLRSTLQNSVAAQLVSDVPVGVFLSGGVDSSLVAALAQRASGRRLQTFSIGFDDPAFDESRFARAVARHIGSDHIEETFSEAKLLDSFDAALDALDEPIADPSILPTCALSQLAARHVKVSLSGDGGDELFAGYPTYKAHRLAAIYARLPSFLRRLAINPIVAKLPVKDGYQTFEWKAKRFALRWDDDAQRRHIRWMSNTDLPDVAALVNSASGGIPFDFRPRAGSLNDILLLDFETYLPGSVLTKVDRASMAYSLEVRPPLLSNDMIDLAFSLPFEWKMQGLQTKSMLKRVAGEFLPAGIVDRRKKGFAIPLAQWLRGPLRPRVDDLLSNSPLWKTGLLNRELFARWTVEHQQRLRDHARTLYAAIVLDSWYRKTVSCRDSSQLPARKHLKHPCSASFA